MLTSFLKNSRPLTLLILCGFLFCSSLVAAFFFYQSNHSSPSFSALLFNSATIAFSLLLLHFINSKNKLSLQNDFIIFVFTFLCLMVPAVFLEPSRILANLFILLAFRRIVSLYKESNVQKKIFDAAFWIALASLFYFWSLLVFIPLWMAVFQKPNRNFKEILIPFVGFFTVLVLFITYLLLSETGLSWFAGWKLPIATDFSIYNNLPLLVPATIIVALFLWVGTSKVFYLQKSSLKQRPKQTILISFTVISIVIALVSPTKNGSELLFLFAPLSILSANYFEKEKAFKKEKADYYEAYFKEFLLWILVLLAFTFFWLWL